MPLIDMPLEKLYQFEGLNERPADMEEYWDRAIAEMEALGTGCELIPAGFQIPGAECFELYFTGVGGARIHGRLARPKRQAGVRHPGVCIFHGYSGSGGSFSGLLRWVAAGFVAVNLDCRGQAGKSDHYRCCWRRSGKHGHPGRPGAGLCEGRLQAISSSAETVW